MRFYLGTLGPWDPATCSTAGRDKMISIPKSFFFAMTTTNRTLPLAIALTVALGASAAPARSIDVVLLGDSLARGTGDETGKGIAGRLGSELKTRGIARVNATNLGVNGATTSEVATRLRTKDTRAAVAHAHAIVLSMGANDVRREFRYGQSARSVFAVIEEVLANIDGVVAELHRLNPSARIFILGAYAPVQQERASVLLEPLVTMWDATLVARFADDPLVEVVRLSDIVNRPERLSRIDSFHPCGEAYQEAAQRIAERIAEPPAVAEPDRLTAPAGSVR